MGSRNVAMRLSRVWGRCVTELGSRVQRGARCGVGVSGRGSLHVPEMPLDTNNGELDLMVRYD